MPRKRKKPKYKKKEVIPPKPSYASILVPNIKEENKETIEEEKLNIHILQPINKNTPTSSFDAWERSYFSHLLDLRDIFANGMINLGESPDELYSYNFLDCFNHFIHDASSGYITPYTTPSIEYEEFNIKRKEFTK